MPSIYIENYGCTANYDDGAIIAGLLTEVGHNVVKDIEDSDVIIINSCAVKNVTVNKIFSQIEQISKNYGKKKLVITGCMPAAEKDKLTKYIKLGVALVSSQNTASMPKVVEKIRLTKNTRQQNSNSTNSTRMQIILQLLLYKISKRRLIFISKRKNHRRT